MLIVHQLSKSYGFEGTILAVVHDRYFIEEFAAQIWEVRGQGLVPHIKLGFQAGIKSPAYNLQGCFPGSASRR